MKATMKTENQNLSWMALATFLVVGNTAFAGVVDGGGGGTLPADPVPVQAVVDVIRGSKLDLRLYARMVSWNGSPGTSPALMKKLFGQRRTLLDLIEDTPIEIKTDAPCYDAGGKEVDGSVYPNPPSAGIGALPFDVCISAQRIAPKLVEERVYGETLALVLHEYSHLLGTTEDEAVEFQKAASEALRRPGKSPFHPLANEIAYRMSRITTDFSMAFGGHPGLDLALAERERSGWSWAQRYVFDKTAWDFYVYQYCRLALVLEYQNISPELPIRHLAQKAFSGGENEITLRQFIERTGLAQFDHEASVVDPVQEFALPNQYLDLRIKRIRDSEDLASETKKLQAYWNELMRYAVNLGRSDVTLPVLHGPWNTDPSQL
jgi:hypothetical protein